MHRTAILPHTLDEKAKQKAKQSEWQRVHEQRQAAGGARSRADSSDRPRAPSRAASSRDINRNMRLEIDSMKMKLEMRRHSLVLAGSHLWLWLWRHVLRCVQGMPNDAPAAAATAAAAADDVVVHQEEAREAKAQHHKSVSFKQLEAAVEIQKHVRSSSKTPVSPRPSVHFSDVAAAVAFEGETAPDEDDVELSVEGNQ